MPVINHRTRTIFLSSLGFIFCAAFLSYYVQFPGLVSSSGVEPVARLLQVVFPKLNKLIESSFGKDNDPYMAITDIICELCAILGVILSCLVARQVYLFLNDFI